MSQNNFDGSDDTSWTDRAECEPMLDHEAQSVDRDSTILTLDEVCELIRKDPTRIASDREVARELYPPEEKIKVTRRSPFGVPLDCPVVSLEYIGTLLKRRPDLFEDEEVERGPTMRKPSRYLRRRDFYDAYEAVLYANRFGYVFNVELTINWQRGGYLLPAEVQLAQRDFNERYRKLCAYLKVTPLYHIVIENSSTIGYHAHIHMHFPHKIQPKLIKWIRASLLCPDGKRFPKSEMKLRRHKDDHTRGQWYWFRYMMKGVDPRLTPNERIIRPAGATFNSEAGIKEYSTGPIVIKRLWQAKRLSRRQRWSKGYRPPDLFSQPFEKRYGNDEYLRSFTDPLTKPKKV